MKLQRPITMGHKSPLTNENFGTHIRNQETKLYHNQTLVGNFWSKMVNTLLVSLSVVHTLWVPRLKLETKHFVSLLAQEVESFKGSTCWFKVAGLESLLRFNICSFPSNKNVRHFTNSPMETVFDEHNIVINIIWIITWMPYDSWRWNT